MVQRLLGAQLYHCYVCRLQFYDNGEVVPWETRSGVSAASKQVARDDTVIGADVGIRGFVVASENILLNGEVHGMARSRFLVTD